MVHDARPAPTTPPWLGVRPGHEGLRLEIGSIAECALEQILELIVLEVLRLEARSLFKDQYREPGGRQLLGHHATRGPRTHDEEIHRVALFESDARHRPISSAS